MSKRTKLSNSRARSRIECQVVPAEFRVNAKAERGELERDVAVRPGIGNAVQHFHVGVTEPHRRLRFADFLTQHVECPSKAQRVQVRDQRQPFIQRITRNVARCDAADKEARQQWRAADDQPVEQSHITAAGAGIKQ